MQIRVLGYANSDGDNAVYHSESLGIALGDAGCAVDGLALLRPGSMVGGGQRGGPERARLGHK